MECLRFDEAELLRRLGQLFESDRAAFAAACAQRLVPSYAKFSIRTGRGNPQTLGEILSRLWQDLDGNPMSDTDLEGQIEACLALIPQEGDGEWVMESAAAEDAASALTYALRCRLSGEAKEAALAARRGYEALDAYVINHEKIDTKEADAEERVLAHSLIQAEFARQNRDLDELLDATVSLDRLRERSKIEAAEFLP